MTITATANEAEHLTRLCHLADLLCLDLTIETRRREGDTLTWDIRYDLPGAPITTDPHGDSESLTAALHNTTVDDALTGLTQRGRQAPGHFVVPLHPPHAPEQAEPRRLARRILGVAAGHAGAQAIWRDGQWWYVPLQRAGVTEVRQPIPGGYLSRLVPRLLRAVEPPDPSWQGPAIPYDRCPTCTDTTTGRVAETARGTTSGQGTTAAGHAAGPCPTCHGTRQIWLGLHLSITDQTGRVRHDHWLPDAGRPIYPPLIAMTDDGRPVVQLPARYRLDDQVAWLLDQPRGPDLPSGQDQPIVELDGSGPVSPALRHGHATLTDPTDDPVSAYLAEVGPGLPGGRLLIGVGMAACRAVLQSSPSTPSDPS